MKTYIISVFFKRSCTYDIPQRKSYLRIPKLGFIFITQWTLILARWQLLASMWFKILHCCQIILRPDVKSGGVVAAVSRPKSWSIFKGSTDAYVHNPLFLPGTLSFHPTSYRVVIIQLAVTFIESVLRWCIATLLLCRLLALSKPWAKRSV